MSNEVKEIEKEIDDANTQDLLKEVIVNNAGEFDFEDVKYKVSSGNYRQRSEARAYKAKKLQEFLKSKEYLFGNELIAKYKSVGIDVLAIESKIKATHKEVEKIQEDLGKLIANTETKEQDYEPFKSKLEELFIKIREYTGEYTELMENSAESQLRVAYYNYLAYLVVEKLDGDKFVKAFKSYDEFMTMDEAFIVQAIYLITNLSGE
jgi:hypothetical protein